jgi:hypothetical protein
MLRPSLAFAFVMLTAAAQNPPPAGASAPAAVAVQAGTLEVPTFPNATCPIMGKKVSLPLFVDTDLGRFYVCCKPCYKKILANLDAAYKTAFPNVQEVKNADCPISGEPIGDEAVPFDLQGYRFRLCCAGCSAEARRHSQVTLTKVTRAHVRDVGNTTCPVSGSSVAANAFAVIDNHVVHLAAPKIADEAAKRPAEVLAKAIANKKAQPPKPKHEHRYVLPSPPPPPPPAKENGG